MHAYRKDVTSLYIDKLLRICICKRKQPCAPVFTDKLCDHVRFRFSIPLALSLFRGSLSVVYSALRLNTRGVLLCMRLEILREQKKKRLPLIDWDCLLSHQIQLSCIISFFCIVCTTHVRAVVPILLSTWRAFVSICLFFVRTITLTFFVFRRAAFGNVAKIISGIVFTPRLPGRNFLCTSVLMHKCVRANRQVHPRACT